METREEEDRRAAEFQAWIDADPEEQRRIQARWARRPVVSIPARVTNDDAAAVLRQLLVNAGPLGIRPSDALRELRSHGHEYKHTGERLRRLLRAAEAKSTGRGRGSRWVTTA